MSSVLAGDPGDVFARVHDRWSLSADVNRLDEWHATHLDRITALAEIVRTTGSVPSTPADTAEDQYVLLAAIDEGFTDCHPRSGTGPGALIGAAVRFLTTGSYAPGDVGGGVIPRWARPRRPGEITDRLADAFHNLIRIRPERWARLRFMHPGVLDLPPVTPVRFAFAPVLRAPEDVRIDTGRGLPGHPAATWYRLNPVRTAVREQIDPLLHELDRSGAHIAVLPEAALDEVLLKTWQQRLRAVRRADGSPLRWLMVGSGPFRVDGDERPANRAVLLHRDSGEELVRHDKFAAFHFADRAQLERWGLDEVIDLTAPVHEGIYRGGTTQLLESAGGRLALLVCEDLTRSGEPVADAVFEAGPSIVLVPVFARKTRKYFWEDQAAGRLRSLVGSTVAVVNSTVVPEAERRRAGTPTAEPPEPFCLLVSADADGTLIGHASEPVVTLP
jgi:predicted amidohydrolase